MNLATFLGNDHARLQALWDDCDHRWLVDRSQTREAFGRFKAGWEPHINWEDDMVFPAYERCAGQAPDRLTVLLSWEHRHLLRYLERLETVLEAPQPTMPLEWVVFAGLLAGHNRREEQLAYPEIERDLTDGELRALLAMLQAAADICPECDRPLASEQSVGGVQP